MTLTYVDTDVLYAAARGTSLISDRALELLSEPDRQFVSGIISMLEVVPVPKYNGRAVEVQFYEEFYTACSHIVQVSEELCRDAYEEAIKHGMGACDAIHVVSAANAGAEELLTGESENHAIHRTNLLNVTRVA